MLQGRTWVAVVVGLVMVAFVPSARAGTYRLWTCHTPDGRPAPIADATSGWKAAKRNGDDPVNQDAACETSGIVSTLHTNARYGGGGTWTFTPPPGTSIGAYAITWSGDVTGGGESTITRPGRQDPDYPARHGASFNQETVTETGLDVGSVTTLVACSFALPPGANCPGEPVANYTITRAVMTLNDLSAPQATEYSGDLLAAATLKGPANVSIAAKDAGGGLYRVVVTADGKDAAAAVIPDSSGRCVNVDPADVYAFKWPQPCPLDVRTTVTVDTASLPEGTHSIGVVLEDAAGNRTTLATPAARTVVHRGTPNGGDGAVLKRIGRYTVTTSFAKRRPTLQGTLTLGGAPVAGALLDVLARNQVSGAALTKIAEVRTDAKGRYRIKVPGGPSRLLRVAYKAYLGDNDYASYTDVSQRVRARVDFKALTRRVSLRGTARFSGRVRGGFVPRRGKVIELQAYDAGRWRAFRTVRTNGSGAFKASYSFKHVNAPRSYRFRARSRYERSYPFLLGTSSTVRLRVG
jgi:hypothetical protein